MCENVFELGSESCVVPPHSKAAESVYPFVAMRSRERFVSTVALVKDLTDEEAVRDARPDWPRHEYWVGQDGSIAGIVYHVAAWRQVYIELLKGRNLEPADVSPTESGWEGTKRWLAESAEEWLRLTESIPKTEVEIPISVPGVSAGLTPLKMMWTMLEHEIEHSAQIAYLIEKQKTEKPNENRG